MDANDAKAQAPNGPQPHGTSDRPRLLGPISIVLMIGIALVVASHHIGRTGEDLRAVAASLVLELGIAFVVGTIVAVTIERYMRTKEEKQRKAREKEMEENIFKALFRTALPDDLVKEMYAILFSRAFLRKKLNIAFTLRSLTDEERKKCDVPDALILTQTVTYDAQNITDRPATHEVSPQEYVLIPHPTLSQPFTRYLAKCEKDEKNLDTEACSKSIDRARTDGFWYYLTAPKIGVPANKVVTVKSTIELICRTTDTRTWITYFPAENLRISVKLDDCLQDRLEFAVDQSHRMPLVPAPGNPVKSDGHRVFVWTLEKPILSYQGITLYWRPKTGS